VCRNAWARSCSEDATLDFVALIPSSRRASCFTQPRYLPSAMPTRLSVTRERLKQFKIEGILTVYRMCRCREQASWNFSKIRVSWASGVRLRWRKQSFTIIDAGISLLRRAFLYNWSLTGAILATNESSGGIKWLNFLRAYRCINALRYILLVSRVSERLSAWSISFFAAFLARHHSRIRSIASKVRRYFITDLSHRHTLIHTDIMPSLNAAIN